MHVSRCIKKVLRTLHKCGEEKTQRRFFISSFIPSRAGPFAFAGKTLNLLFFLCLQKKGRNNGKAHGANPAQAPQLPYPQSTTDEQSTHFGAPSSAKPALFSHRFFFFEELKKTSSQEATASKDLDRLLQLFSGRLSPGWVTTTKLRNQEPSADRRHRSYQGS